MLRRQASLGQEQEYNFHLRRGVTSRRNQSIPSHRRQTRHSRPADNLKHVSHRIACSPQRIQPTGSRGCSRHMQTVQHPTGEGTFQLSNCSLEMAGVYHSQFIIMQRMELQLKMVIA